MHSSVVQARRSGQQPSRSLATYDLLLLYCMFERVVQPASTSLDRGRAGRVEHPQTTHIDDVLWQLQWREQGVCRGSLEGARETV